MDCDYTCGLNADFLKRAKDELTEDPRNRLGAVRKLREWIDDQPHLQFPTDTNTLLMYLRHAKFSQLKARETIEKYCKLKSSEEGYIYNDYTIQGLLEWVKRGYDTVIPFRQLFILPGRGNKGQIRYVYRWEAFEKEPQKDWLKTFFVFLSILSMDEETQVGGQEFFVDCTGFTMEHQTFLTMKDTGILAKHWTRSIPVRIRGLHYYNENAFFNAIMSLFRRFAGRKIRNRLHMHGPHMTKVYKHISKKCLPIEYLPDDYTGPNGGTMQSMIDATVEKLQSPGVAKYLAHWTDAKWGIDPSKKPKDGCLNTSFRRLSVF